MLGKLNINNPGNIRINDDKFVGEIVPSSDAAFKEFESMVHGYRAMFKVLETYRNKGFNTIADIISRWAPAFENDTQGYINFVAGNMKVPEYALLDMDNEDTMTKLVSNMAMMENGTFANYNDVKQGWNMAHNITGEIKAIVTTSAGKTSMYVGVGIVTFSLLLGVTIITKRRK